MPTFITPYSGQAELTASTGLTVVSQGLWRFSQSGYNDGATFGVSLTHPTPNDAGLLHVQAINWNIQDIGNELTSYYDEDAGETYPASKCRIMVTGRWQVTRQVNSNSWNGIGVSWSGNTDTDLGDRAFNGYLLNFWSNYSTYEIQGSGVTGGAKNTFSDHVFYCKCTETATGSNSNKEYQSNTISRPVWAYTYTKGWQID